MSAILDNSLNFKAKVTTSRDINAYKKLEKIANIDFNYAEFYFTECKTEIEKNIEESIYNDTKLENSGTKVPPVFSQLTLWNAKSILENTKIIYKVLNQFDKPWLINIISLDSGNSYLISNNEVVRKNIENTFNCSFNNDTATLPKVWLRKEIIRELL